MTRAVVRLTSIIVNRRIALTRKVVKRNFYIFDRGFWGNTARGRTRALPPGTWRFRQKGGHIGPPLQGVLSVEGQSLGEWPDLGVRPHKEGGLLSKNLPSRKRADTQVRPYIMKPDGRAIGGERSVDKTPLNTPANTTILSSVRRNGGTAYTIYGGGTTREKFLDYLKNTLIPTPREGDIAVMDNMRAHHAKEVQTLLRRAGMKLLRLPARSPDWNPIENTRSKAKAILRELKIRLLPQLPHGMLRLSR